MPITAGLISIAATASKQSGTTTSPASRTDLTPNRMPARQMAKAITSRPIIAQQGPRDVKKMDSLSSFNVLSTIR